MTVLACSKTSPGVAGQAKDVALGSCGLQYSVIQTGLPLEDLSVKLVGLLVLLWSHFQMLRISLLSVDIWNMAP